MKQFRVDVDFRVTKSIYVDAETAEQAEQIVEQRCKDNPYQYTSNPDCSELDAIVEVNEEEEPDPLADYSEDYRKGIAYMKEQLEDFEKDIIRAKVNRNYAQHDSPSTGLDDHRIIDLLEEYGQDNDLPEGWYLDEYDADDVMLML